MTASDPHEVLQGHLVHVVLIEPLFLSEVGKLDLQSASYHSDGLQFAPFVLGGDANIPRCIRII